MYNENSKIIVFLVVMFTSLQILLQLVFPTSRLVPVEENFLIKSLFQSAEKITDDYIDRVFSYYDEVHLFHSEISSRKALLNLSQH